MACGAEKFSCETHEPNFPHTRPKTPCGLQRFHVASGEIDTPHFEATSKGQFHVNQRIPTIAAVGALVAAASVLAGCGSSSSSDTTTAKSDFKAGLVTDIGGVNDKSFNFLAKQGLDAAAAKIGFTPDIKESKAETDYVPNLTRLISGGDKGVITVGFLMGQATGDMAKANPGVNFAIVDFSVTDKAIGGQKNVRGLLFKEQEAGYLAGYLAGKVELANIARTNKQMVIGAVGGLKIPPVDRYIAGYKAGAQAAAPGIKVLVGYSQSFTEQDKCKEQSLAHIEAGSDIEFQVAGTCGLGVLSAAKDKNIWGIGVDADQAYIGDQILTSALKRVDVAVEKAITDMSGGSFVGGSDEVFDLKANGVGLGAVSKDVPQGILDELEKIKADIIAGKITIPDTV